MDQEELKKRGKALAQKAVRTAKKTGRYVEHYGVTEVARKAAEYGLTHEDYDSIRLSEIASEEELAHERENPIADGPRISILVPVYEPSETGFRQMLESVKAQTYENWELCLADASEEPLKKLSELIGAEKYDRVRYMKLSENGGISANTNKALMAASGEYVAFLDQDDILEPNALYELVSALTPETDLAYTDEDKVSHDLEHYERPFRKPDYNETLLFTTNYICHFLLLRRSLVEKLGGLRQDYDGAQDYDLILRAVDLIRKEHGAVAPRIAHVAKVLYHWRMDDSSASGDAFAKEYAFKAGRAALEDAVKRRPEYENLDVRVHALKNPGYYRLKIGRGDYPMDEIMDYVFLKSENMEITGGSIQDLIERALLTGADVVIPRQLKAGRYLYQGIARAGKGHTVSLKGKPAWYHGPYQMAMVDMEVDVAPCDGILIRKEYVPALKAQLAARKDPAAEGRSSRINRKQEWSKDLKMVYAPEVELTE